MCVLRTGEKSKCLDFVLQQSGPSYMQGHLDGYVRSEYASHCLCTSESLSSNPTMKHPGSCNSSELRRSHPVRYQYTLYLYFMLGYILRGIPAIAEKCSKSSSKTVQIPFLHYSNASHFQLILPIAHTCSNVEDCFVVIGKQHQTP